MKKILISLMVLFSAHSFAWIGDDIDTHGFEDYQSQQKALNQERQIADQEERLNKIESERQQERWDELSR